MTVAPIKNGNFRRSSHFVIGRAWPPVYHSAWKTISPVKFTALCRCKFIRLWGRTSTEPWIVQFERLFCTLLLYTGVQKIFQKSRHHNNLKDVILR
jgi:hypothetical protein